jgi:hypothetical protein
MFQDDPATRDPTDPIGPALVNDTNKVTEFLLGDPRKIGDPSTIGTYFLWA